MMENKNDLTQDAVDRLVAKNQRITDARAEHLTVLLNAFLQKASELARLDIHENDPNYWTQKSSVRQTVEHALEQINTLLHCAKNESKMAELQFEALDAFESMI